jgi:hypothetical protein
MLCPKCKEVSYNGYNYYCMFCSDGPNPPLWCRRCQLELQIRFGRGMSYVCHKELCRKCTTTIPYFKLPIDEQRGFYLFVFEVCDLLEAMEAISYEW